MIGNAMAAGQNTATSLLLPHACHAEPPLTSISIYNLIQL